MKEFFVILFIISISLRLHAQENIMKNTAIPAKWSANFDKNKLESLYPGSEFKKSPIKGIWIGEEVITDTIVFYPYYDGSEPVFCLERGRTENDGLPKKNSGLYNYRLENGEIRIQWYLSSTINYTPYHIKISGDSNKLEIGNFYSSTHQGNDTLIFNRVNKQ